MDFTIKLEELQHILKCMRASVKVNTIDLPGRLVIHVSEGDGVRFAGSNDDTGISVVSKTGVVKAPGDVAVVYGKLQSFIFSFTPWVEEKRGVKEVHFKLNKNSLSVLLNNTQPNGKKSKSSIRLEIFDVLISDYDKKLNEIHFTLTDSILSASIDKVNPAIDSNHYVSYIRGACLRFENDFVYIGALNGTVVSEFRFKNPSTIKDEVHILSHKFISALRSLLSNLSRDVEIMASFNITKGVITVQMDNVLMWGRLIVSKKYPDYRTEFDMPFKHTIVVNKDVFVNNLNPIVGSLDSDDNDRLTIEINKDIIKLYNDYAESSFEFELGFEDNKPVEESFIADANGKAFKDIVNSIQDDYIVMQVVDDKHHILFNSKLLGDQRSVVTTLRRRSV